MRYSCRVPAAGREPVQNAAEAHQRDAIAARQIRGGERGGSAHRGVECALLRVLGLGECVEEQDDVGALLGMLHVHVRDAAARGRAPVDSPHAVAGHERTKVGELDALAALAGNLAAEHRSGPERGDEPVQPADAGVGAKLDTTGRAGPRARTRQAGRGRGPPRGPASWTPQRSTASSNSISRCSPRRSQKAIGSGRCAAAPTSADAAPRGRGRRRSARSTSRVAALPRGRVRVRA